MSEQAETAITETETVEEPRATEATPEAGETLEARMARIEAALKKANHEAAKYRKQAEALEQADAKRKEAELSELEKLQKRLAETEAEANRLKLQGLQRTAAEKAGLPASTGYQAPGRDARRAGGRRRGAG